MTAAGGGLRCSGPLGVGLLALTLALTLALGACGGAGEGSAPAGEAPSTPAPAPAAAGFVMLPQRAAMGVGASRHLLVLQPGGALVWTSSNPAVASVDADGKVTALAAGQATISASVGAQSLSATVTVHGAAAAVPGALIAAALAQNAITAEQALSYRVFAFFGDPRLPAAYEGPPSALPDHQLLREVAGKLPTLSPATQDLLLPFLLPPIYQESWHAQQLAPAAAPGLAAGRMRALASALREGRSATSVNCRVAQNPTGWLRLATAHFNIHYPDVQPGNGAEANIAQAIAAVVEDAYASLTGVLGRYPISDLGRACNGGDGALDIYLNYFMAGAQFAATTTYPGACEATPSYIAINSSQPLFRVDAAQRPGDAGVLRAVKAVLAHEIAHVLQFTMDRQAACDDYVWADEGTAQWAMEHVDSTFDLEDGFTHLTTAATRSGSFLLRYLSRDHLSSIEKPGADEQIADHGYAEYLFFQYLARQFSPAVIRQVHDAQVGQASVEAVASALASHGGFKAVWPDFARTLWIGRAEQVLDYWSVQDRYDYGLARIYAPSAGDAFAAGLPRLKTVKVDQLGQARATFKLLDNALNTASGSYEIDQRSVHYEHLKFSDATVSSVMLINPIAILPQHDHMKLQAVKKIGGVWQAVEDWTQDSTKSLCLDKKDERIEELILIVSNSEVERGADEPFRIPGLFPMRLSTSNVGCWKWTGTASTTTTYDDGNGLSGSATGSAVVSWEVSATLPGSVHFEPHTGFVDGVSRGRLAGCTFEETAERRLLDANGPSAGRLYVNLDLEFGLGEPPNRELSAFDGLAALQASRTLTCPGVVVTRTGPAGYTWLQVDSAVSYAVAADGRTLQGQYIASFPATRSSISTVFNFTAQRE